MCNKSHLKLFSYLKIPRQLYYEKKGNFMLGHQEFYSKGFNFSKTLKIVYKKTNADREIIPANVNKIFVTLQESPYIHRSDIRIRIKFQHQIHFV